MSPRFRRFDIINFFLLLQVILKNNISFFFILVNRSCRQDHRAILTGLVSRSRVRQKVIFDKSAKWSIRNFYWMKLFSVRSLHTFLSMRIRMNWTRSFLLSLRQINYSWLASLVPKNPELRNSIWNDFSIDIKIFI